MIYIKQTLSKKHKKIVGIILTEVTDLYGDFYLTKNNLRLYIKDNDHLLYEGLKKGDRIIFDEEGIAVIIGFSDKAQRKYLKVLTNDARVADKLVKNVIWNCSTEIYCKIKKSNPLKQILLNNKFKFVGDRGKEILLVKEKTDYEIGKKLQKRIEEKEIENANQNKKENQKSC